MSIDGSKKKNAYKPKPKKPLTKRVSKPKELVKASWHIEESHGTVVLTVPIHTVSEANKKEFWLTAAKRHIKQKQIIKAYFLKVKKLISLPCSVLFIRLAPRTLDSADNLPMSLKWIIDSVCEELTGNYVHGRADSDERIKIYTSQEKSKQYGVKLKFDMIPYHIQ